MNTLWFSQTNRATWYKIQIDFSKSAYTEVYTQGFIWELFYSLLNQSQGNMWQILQGKIKSAFTW